MARENAVDYSSTFRMMTKAKFFKTEQPSRIFGHIPQSALSLEEVPLEYIDLKRVNQKSSPANDFSMNFGSTNSHSSGVNPSYFNVPIACCFSKEIINLHLDNKNLDIAYLTTLYTDQKPMDDSHESKV